MNISPLVSIFHTADHAYDRAMRELHGGVAVSRATLKGIVSDFARVSDRVDAWDRTHEVNQRDEERLKQVWQRAESGLGDLVRAYEQLGVNPGGSYRMLGSAVGELRESRELLRLTIRSLELRNYSSRPADLS